MLSTVAPLTPQDAQIYSMGARPLEVQTPQVITLAAGVGQTVFPEDGGKGVLRTIQVVGTGGVLVGINTVPTATSYHASIKAAGTDHDADGGSFDGSSFQGSIGVFSAAGSKVALIYGKFPTNN